MLLNFYTPTVEYKENFFLKGAPSKTKTKQKGTNPATGERSWALVVPRDADSHFSFPNLPRVLCFLPLL